MNKRKTQYVIKKKKIKGEKPKGLNIATILEVMETQCEAQYQYLTVSISIHQHQSHHHI